MADLGGELVEVPPLDGLQRKRLLEGTGLLA
jgi:hypothetical protein